MTKEEFDVMEVKPKNEGWYYVTLYQFEKLGIKNPDYIRDWLYFNGNDWDYEGYINKCYVCFIHRSE